MLFKFFVILILLVIFYCLGSGLYYLARERESRRQLAVALTWRVALSFFLFALMIVAYFFGWIQPHMMVVVPKT